MDIGYTNSKFVNILVLVSKIELDETSSPQYACIYNGLLTSSVTEHPFPLMATSHPSNPSFAMSVPTDSNAVAELGGSNPSDKELDFPQVSVQVSVVFSVRAYCLLPVQH